MFLAEEQSVPYPYFGQLIGESLSKKNWKKKEKNLLVVFYLECKFIFTLGKFWPADVHTKSTAPTTAIKHARCQTKNVCVPTVDWCTLTTEQYHLL